MRKRTLSRSFALQVLYQMDITGDSYAECLDTFWQDVKNPIEDEVKQFTAQLVKGVKDNLQAIDKKIVAHATNWQIQRMAVVDRNVLRLSCYELIFRSDIPPKVSINEAVELAKKFSGLEAGKFVNGILDKIKSDKSE
jgi:transcription antitermination factor NusB